MSKNVYVVDIEADALYDDVSEVHVVSYTPLSHLEVKSLTTEKDIKEFFSQEGLVVIGHNFIDYDSRVLEKIYGIPINYKIIDTLGISWYLESSSNRTKHGLEAWGEDLGVQKPVIEDWSSNNIEAIIKRCETDVVINWKLFKEVQQPYLKELYNNDVDEIRRLLDYITFKLECFTEQQSTGVVLDVGTCISAITELQKLADEKTKALTEAMPKVPIKGVKSKPKVMYLKDGELSSLGQKWLDFLDERGLGPNTEGPIEYVKGYEDGNPASGEQVKSWLFSLGWTPKHIKFQRNKQTNEYKQIPQIVSEHDKSKVCDSVLELVEKEPAIEHLSGLSTINHRIGVLKGFIRDFKPNGRIYQELGGFTNTFRAKHRVLANLPKPGNPWADDIRACLMSGEGMSLCGADLSGIEDATKQHYIYPFDPEYVDSMRTDDWDAHIDMAVRAGLITEDDERFFKTYKEDTASDEDKVRYKNIKKIRQEAKVVNFSATYSVGAKTLARNMKVDVKKAQKVLDAYWERNKAIKQFCATVERKTVRGQMWAKQPVSGFWYSLRQEKDIFSTINQGTAVYVFDTWVKYTRQQSIKIAFQVHDEQSFEFEAGKEDEIREKIKKAIDLTNEELKLNIKVDCSVDFGKRYTDVH